MSNFIGNSERIEFLKGQAALLAGNYFARFGRPEIAMEEYQQALAAYNLVQQTFPDFMETQSQKKIVQEMLDKLFGPLLELGKWLVNEFEKAQEAGWLLLTDVFRDHAFDFRRLAFRTTAVKRAKLINLGIDKVILVIGLNELPETQEIKVVIRVYPLDGQNYLPANLKFTVLPKVGESHVYLANPHDPGFEMEWFYKRGEQFDVQIQLNNFTVTEHFMV